MLAAAILYWPNFADNLASVRSMAAPLPIVGEWLDQIEDTGALGYILGQHFFKGCNTLGAAAAVLFAAPAVAGEAHRGTLELWLARPISRARLLLERWGLGALALLAPILVSTLTIPPLAARVDEAETLAPYLLCAAHQSAFLLALYSLTFLLSCLGSQPMRIALSVLFVVIFELAIYVIKVLTHYSIFRLCDLQVLLRVAEDEQLDGARLWPLLAASVVFLGASLLAFRRRTP